MKETNNVKWPEEDKQTIAPLKRFFLSTYSSPIINLFHLL
jgi:hypothetical protein